MERRVGPLYLWRQTSSRPRHDLRLPGTQRGGHCPGVPADLEAGAGAGSIEGGDGERRRDKIKANASIHKSLRYDRAGELEAQLELEIGGLMAKAREAESSEPGRRKNWPASSNGWKRCG